MKIRHLKPQTYNRLTKINLRINIPHFAVCRKDVSKLKSLSNACEICILCFNPYYQILETDISNKIPDIADLQQQLKYTKPISRL